MSSRKTKKRARSPEAPTDTLPAGISVRVVLEEQSPIARSAWSPDGSLFATAADDASVKTWDGTDFSLVKVFEHDDLGQARSLSWSADSTRLIVGFDRGARLWGLSGRRLAVPERLKQLGGRSQVAWSPSELVVAFGNEDGVATWDSRTGVVASLPGCHSFSFSLGWSADGSALLVQDLTRAASLVGHDGQVLFSVPESHAFDTAFYPEHSLMAFGKDASIVIVDVRRRAVVTQIEGVESWGLAFSSDGSLLVSRARNLVRIWRCDDWTESASFYVTAEEGRIPSVPPNVDCHPTKPYFAVSVGGEVRVLEVDPAVLLGHTVRSSSDTESTHYSNAKVVLVGNTSVGKSGLGLVLSGKKFRPTESTHGRHIWPLEDDIAPTRGQRGIRRETLLWDLAGQPGYRLIHQLHLSEVAVALVLFDSRSETDPFAGIPYWAGALDNASLNKRIVKLLVASRGDRGGPQVSRTRIDEVMQRHGFSGFFETSAKRGDGIAALRQAIVEAIPWDDLPHIVASQTFKAAKDLVVKEKRSGTVLVTASDLFDRFTTHRATQDITEVEFDICLGRLETAGLIRRLSFGGNVLLQPERLDDYCGWLAHAARAQPDGLGYIAEDDARAGRFRMDDDRRIKTKADERVMLLAMVEEVVGHNIAYRQLTEQGAMLVFPSELNADLPAYPGGYSLAVVFQFQGPVSGIYATLAVGLINSTPFKKKDLYKNAALFQGPQGRVCGFAVEQPDRNNDSVGRLTVFFDASTDRGLRLLFLRYVNQQLERLVFAGTLTRDRVYHCAPCNYAIPSDVVTRRRANGETTVMCPIGGEVYPLDDLAERSVDADERVDSIEREAEAERERQTRLTTLAERARTKQYHVFLCYNHTDREMVSQISSALREQGVLPWFDDETVLAGDRFPAAIERAIDTARVVAVLIGPKGMGRWQDMEYQAALQRSIERRDDDAPSVRLIPVLLPGAAKDPTLPAFLRGLSQVDLRKGGADNADQMRRLVTTILAGPNPTFAEGSHVLWVNSKPV